MIFLISLKGYSQEQAINPITYDFNLNSILDIDQENNPNYYNLKNQSYYNGNYLADMTYIADYESHIDTEDSNDFIDSFHGHSEVIDQYGNYPKANLLDDYDLMSSGIFEFWHYIETNDSDSDQIINLRADDDTYGVRIQSNGNLYQYRDQTGYYSIGYMPIQTWVHWKIVFNCTTDTFDVYWNNQLKGYDLGFWIEISNISRVRLWHYNSNYPTENYHVYYDGLDMSCSQNYYENRNFIPQLENTNQIEVDKYEFDYNYDDFENGLTDWIQNEATGSYNQIQIIGTKDIDKYMSFSMFYGAIYSQELHYNRQSDSMILNLTMEINLESLTPYVYQLWFIMSPKNLADSTDRIIFRIKDDVDTFEIYNQESENYNNIFSITQDQTIYINIYINSYDKLYIFRIIDGSNSYVLNYNYDIDDNDLYGIDNFYFYGYCAEASNPSGFNSTIDNFGIYENGLSILNRTNTNEFGLMYYEISNSWNSDNHNLLTIDSNNYYDIYVNNYYDYYLDGYSIERKFNQTESKTFNLQDKYNYNYQKFIYTNPYLIFKLFGNCTNFYEIEIEGIQLINNNEITYGNYYYNNTDSNYNWFYGVDNKLYYNFNNNDSSGLETMSITFNINDILMNNGSLLSFSSYITNNYSGYIYLSSYHGSESFKLSQNSTLTNQYLNITNNEHFTINQITIEIQSNYNSSGLAEGYIQNINIYPEKPLFPDFQPIIYLQSSFLEKMIETIIPIIFFIVPSLLVRTKFGAKAVIPIWILLTFIFLIANFIPFWICFIIFLSIGLMTLNKENEGLE